MGVKLVSVVVVVRPPLSAEACDAVMIQMMGRGPSWDFLEEFIGKYVRRRRMTWWVEMSLTKI